MLLILFHQFVLVLSSIFGSTYSNELMSNQLHPSVYWFHMIHSRSILSVCAGLNVALTAFCTSKDSCSCFQQSSHPLRSVMNKFIEILEIEIKSETTLTELMNLFSGNLFGSGILGSL